MVTVQVYEHMSEDCQFYSIKIPYNDFVMLEFNEGEREMIRKTKEGGIISPSFFLQVMLMIVKKIENRKPLDSEDNSLSPRLPILLNELFVDHLVMNLEEKSIGQILIFLAQYCGWDQILKFIEENKNG